PTEINVSHGAIAVRRTVTPSVRAEPCLLRCTDRPKGIPDIRDPTTGRITIDDLRPPTDHLRANNVNPFSAPRGSHIVDDGRIALIDRHAIPCPIESVIRPVSISDRAISHDRIETGTKA